MVNVITHTTNQYINAGLVVQNTGKEKDAKTIKTIFCLLVNCEELFIINTISQKLCLGQVQEFKGKICKICHVSLMQL